MQSLENGKVYGRISFHHSAVQRKQTLTEQSEHVRRQNPHLQHFQFTKHSLHFFIFVIICMYACMYVCMYIFMYVCINQFALLFTKEHNSVTTSNSLSRVV